MKPNALRKATIGQLLDEYKEAALLHRSASRTGDYKKANPAYHRIVAVVHELRARGQEAHRALVALLDDQRIEIRGWAAVHLLELVPEKAKKVLETIAGGPHSPERLSAEMVLQQWHSGQLKFP